MKILVTGGAGFIGSHVVDAYVAEGHEVTVVDALFRESEENLNPGAVFHRANLCDAAALRAVFERERPEWVNHHAAHVDVRRAVEDPAHDARQNILGTVNLLEHCREFGVGKVIFISSGGAAYGEPESLPVREDHPVRPLSPYGLSKYVGEKYVELYARLHGLDYTILRYPNVYGPRQDPAGEAGVVAIFTERIRAGRRPTIFGDGTKTRDYVFVGDLVRANLLVTGDAGRREAFNLGWSAEVTDREVFEAVRDALGADMEPIYGERRPGEVERICLDASKAEKELGWRPEVSFREGVRRTVSAGGE
ncbi:MAG: NAD-dependent epimerase/dehydratase family protein [Nitrospinota bacterium]|nr:NAD-dependent epimerase/dehydratase family protein [Nitrospinota bacterium]